MCTLTYRTRSLVMTERRPSKKLFFCRQQEFLYYHLLNRWLEKIRDIKRITYQVHYQNFIIPGVSICGNKVANMSLRESYF